MSFYDNMSALAEKLLTKYGAAATLSYGAAGTYDEETDLMIEGTVTDVTCLAVIRPKRFVSDSGVVTVKSVATLNAPPKIGDTLTLGRTYKVAEVEEIAPTGGAAIMYRAILA